MIRSFHKYRSFNITANVPIVKDYDGEFIAFKTVTGVVEVSYTNDDGFFQVFTGDKVRLKDGESFDRIMIRSTSGGSIAFVHGIGDYEFSSSTTSSGDTNVQLITGAYDDPNTGGVVPTDLLSPAIYYKDSAVTVKVWSWSVTNQNWFALIT